LQALGHCIQAGVGPHRDRALAQLPQLVQPLRQPARRLRGPRGGHAEAFQVDQPADARRPRAGVLHGDVAAHAVAHQIHLLRTGRDVVEQRVQIAQVVGEGVVVARRRQRGQAEAAPVRRDDQASRGEGFAERIDHELVGGAHVHPPVHQHQRRCIRRGRAPAGDVEVEVAQRQDFAVARAGRGVAHGRRLFRPAFIGAGAGLWLRLSDSTPSPT